MLPPSCFRQNRSRYCYPSCKRRFPRTSRKKCFLLQPDSCQELTHFQRPYSSRSLYFLPGIPSLDTVHEAVLSHLYSFPENPGKSDKLQSSHLRNKRPGSVCRKKKHNRYQTDHCFLYTGSDTRFFRLFLFFLL